MSAARILELVAMADEAPTGAELAAYLVDDDAAVRRTAVDVLTESAPPDAGVALAPMLLDADAAVRGAAIEGLRELREVIVADPAFATALAAAARAPQPEVRAAVVRLWWEHKLAAVDDYVAVAGDRDPLVRIEAVGGLVSLDAVADLAALAGDDDPLVRLAVVRGLATVGDPTAIGVLEARAHDDDVRVRAAAIEGFAAVGLGPSTESLVSDLVADARWEIRKAAALALAQASPDVAVPALVVAAGDENQDVRKAAVQGLARWATDEAVRGVLEGALADPDADVRGYARLALT